MYTHGKEGKGRDRSRTGQREKLRFSAISAGASAGSPRSAESGMTVQNGPEFR